MASTSSLKFLILLVASFAVVKLTTAGDADILTDFVAPANGAADANYFTYTGMQDVIGAPFPAQFKVTKASMAEFPALNGQSVSYAVLQFPNGTVNPPHTHPRGTELLFVAFGSLEVGLVDTTNKIYTQTLQAGDMFVFPKGLVHYQYNPDPVKPAMAVSAFGSASAGTVSTPVTLFGTNIDDNILAIAFKTDVQTIQHLKAGLAPKA